MNKYLSEQDHFFSRVSHDLRGSFTSILGFSDILNDFDENLSNEEIKEFTKRIGKQTHDSFNLLVNFINWLKLEHYNNRLTLEKIDMFEVLYEAENNYKSKFLKKDIKTELEIEENQFVRMDFEIIQSIFNNIFLFLMKISNQDSKLIISSKSNDSNYIKVEIFFSSNHLDISYLQNINLIELNNNLSFPMIFAIKFTELSGGSFKIGSEKDNSLIIEMKLPKFT
ncbi:MAG: hypothetical protein CR986_09945 [Ignavibacteriae bacterium]|nr:MAG: hypothetical protein CR986_09945 [Ignavibacteriota bacterium]